MPAHSAARPAAGLTHFPRFGIDPPFVGDGDGFVAFVGVTCPPDLVDHLGVHDVVDTGTAGLSARRRRGRLGGLSGLVDRLSQRLRLLAELLHRRLDRIDVGATERGLGVGHRGVDLVERVLGNLRTAGSAFASFSATNFSVW